MGKIKLIDGKIEFEGDEFDQLQNMLYWISRKYNGWSRLESEDLESELWIKAINIIKDTGEINMNLIAMSCYHYAIDICRKYKRQAKFFPTDGFMEVGDDSSQTPIPFSLNIINKSSRDLARNNNQRYGSSLLIQDMLDLFDPESKEYKFIRLAALYHDIEIPENVEDGWRFEDIFTRDRYEYSMAKALGFADDTSTGYRNLRGRVRDALYQNGFYDLLDLDKSGRWY